MISFQEALDIINKEVAGIIYPHQPDGLYSPIRYILSLKGKKIRPVLTILACNLFKEDIKDALKPALAWEAFHNFTLMHDDVMDNADIRRGQPTVHKVWNENTAILSGDSMLILAYQFISMVPGDKLKVLLDLFSTTAAQICEGQQYDMEFENRLDVNEKEYVEMIRLKTAVLLGASLQTGAIIGGASEEDVVNLYGFGVNLGLAFQIKDDLLDVYGDPLVFGKNIGGDILCNKKTYLLVNALNLSVGEDHKSLLEWLSMKTYNEKEKINAVTAIYDKLELKSIAEEKMNNYFEKAIEYLSFVGVEDKSKKILLDLAKQLMDREV